VNFMVPLGLSLGALALPLLAMYFLKIRRRRVRVPSLLLWERFAKNEQLASPFQRFRRHLLLLLQLLILLLCVLAFARPVLDGMVGGGRSVVLVVDTSASMGATDEAPNRLGAALLRAVSTVESLSPGDEALIVEAGAQTRVVTPFTRDVAVLRESLNGLEVHEAEGDLREGMQLALSLVSTRPNVEVVVFSDGGHESLAGLNVNATPVSFEHVGRSSANAGIVAMDIRSSPASDLDRQLFVTAQNFGEKGVQAELQVYLADELVGHRRISLDPDKPAPMVFELPPSSVGVLKATLKTRGDLLEVDNTAFAILTPLARRKVLVVDGDALTVRALVADPRFSVSVAAADAVKKDQLPEYDAIFFMKQVPVDPTGTNYAVMGPFVGAPASFEGSYRSPKVLGWRRTHPSMRFVQWDGILFSKASNVSDAGGLATLVDGDRGPLVLAGEVQGGRVFQMAFDPWTSDMPLRVAWPVMVLNAAGWLTTGQYQARPAGSVKTGQPIVRRLPGRSESDGVRVLGPDGQKMRFEMSDNLLRVQDTRRVGVYTVQGSGLSARVAANLTSLSESRIRPRRAVDVGEAETSIVEASVAGRYELWRWMLLAALLVLCIEWWVWHRRRVI